MDKEEINRIREESRKDFEEAIKKINKRFLIGGVIILAIFFTALVLVTYWLLV
jgi:hypothetical protein